MNLKFAAICLFTLLVGGTTFAQIDSVEIDGKYYNVYPFREKPHIPSEYWITVKDKAYFQKYENYFEIFGEGRSFTREMFETAESEEELAFLNKRLKRYWKNNRTKDLFGFGPRFVKQVRKNPASLIMPRYEFDKEVLPPFEAIPDGQYVQLYSTFCWVDEHGMCTEQTNRVAGYFNIKNNALDGYAVWVNLEGDTIKEGNFKNGLKEGKWIMRDVQKPSRYLSRYSTKPQRKNGYLNLDTTYITAEYSHGVLNGSYSYYETGSRLKISGYYSDGYESGNWKTYWDTMLVKNVTFADRSLETVSKTPIIRTSSFLSGYWWEHNLRGYTYGRYEIPNDFYEIAFNYDKELELEEEEFQSHELEYYQPYESIGIPERFKKDEYYDYSRSYNYNLYNMYEFIKDPETDWVETRGHFIDSLGARMFYDGPYELYYPNGQLYTRYLFDKGTLVSEDTLFWDNGNPHDVIEFVPDSNFYYRHAYDYDGLHMKTAIYDSIGDFLRYNEVVKNDVEKLEIDGITAIMSDLPRYTKKDFDTIMQGNYYYRNFEVLDSVLPSNDKLTLYRLYSGFDTSILSEITFDPITRTYTDYDISYTGKEFWRIDRVFTENYKSWTGKTSWEYGRFKIVITASGILGEFENDTLPHVHVGSAHSHYDVTEDVEIFKDGELYNGKFKFNRDALLTKLPNRKLVLRSGYNTRTYRNQKKLYKYFTKGKLSNDTDLSIINDVGNCSMTNTRVSRMLFDLASEDYFSYKLSSGGRYDYYFGKRVSQLGKVKGYMAEGKPQGTFKGKNRGKLMSEIAFDKGEAIGTLKQYSIQKRSPRWDRKTSTDSLSKHRVYYLERTTEYVNGKKEGPFKKFTWYGDIEEEGTYKDDYLEGEYFTTYPLAYSVANFKDGMLDGYVQTYLTLPYEDTLLLYDLNFQHGLLNGESNAYHTNGRLAKRGFFLDGEPIDDYEAYDTLGFKYHYVKFKYGFPVEEKIWEENQLSLRYMFNWEDSVTFDPSDITSSMSLESLLYRLGYGLSNLENEYYGRPRLINKSGLNYHMTKFYPNDTIARKGRIDDGKKIGHWDFYDYDGEFLYEVDYYDSILVLNDSVKFKSKGVLTDWDSNGNKLFEAYIIEKMEKYDCAHTDHYEIRQLLTRWEAHDSIGRMNGYVRNYYDNGTLQNEGYMKDGLPQGLWKYYDPFGKLNLMGSFHQGKRHGRWLQGDLEKKKYLGEICLNPNLPDLEKEKKYRENLLDVTIITYDLGRSVTKQFFDLNLNKFSNMVVE